jgi:hypothetical protein
MFWKLLFLPLFLATLPSTTNYQLNSYGFGSGGTAGSSTPNYSLEGISGEIGGQTGTTATYNLKPGFIETQQANVPKVTLTNPANYYDKLKFAIDEQANPTDAKYALQVKVNDVSCDFTTGTIRYVKNDDTLGATLATTDYQTYTTWGGASGANIIGLASNTTYCIRAKATQGQFTESGYGPSTSAATVGQSLSFCIYTNANCGAGGNSVAFSGLVAGSIASAPNNSGVFAIGADFATNADFGGNVYIYDLNGGLHSTAASYTLASATANLSSVNEGFGAQIVSVTQTTGGPLSKVSPYDGTLNNVGILSGSIATLFSSSNPLTGGVGKTQLMVKPANTTPEADDYTDTITLIAAASF